MRDESIAQAEALISDLRREREDRLLEEIRCLPEVGQVSRAWGENEPDAWVRLAGAVLGLRGAPKMAEERKASENRVLEQLRALPELGELALALERGEPCRHAWFALSEAIFRLSSSSPSR